MYDYDRELVLEILSQIKNSLETILYRFEPIERIEDFTDSPWGMEKLDSICMQLIAIGEGVKKIDKITKGSLFSKYPQIDWKGVKGMRDIISHHYFDVDAEIIYEVCKNKIPELKDVILRILTDLKEKQ
ncbi:MAG TPA: DUF86 domain-containing protein [Candidatus Desulfofervidus auxilii]|uniref:DUF86 domain-containing protein n=1 Tax=Desulfofervidus auxilii TaxID=1621989 RepID=A0A7C2AL29_DESA2|nr:DUF86 domain-containing protein [Candidatus Desulfofervidus auxilii]